MPADLGSYLVSGAGLIIVGIQGWVLKVIMWTRDEVIKLRTVINGDEIDGGLRKDVRKLQEDLQVPRIVRHYKHEGDTEK